MKIAYFSPLPPEATGIADFSRELLEGFYVYAGESIEIDLFYRNGDLQDEGLKTHFSVYPCERIEDESIRNQYDHLVYQVGNNIQYHGWIIEIFLRYPGILELHDFALHHYLAEKYLTGNDTRSYIEMMWQSHNVAGLQEALDFLNGKTGQPWENPSGRFFVNKYLVDVAKAVIVHSDHAKQMVLGMVPRKSVVSIPLHTSNLVVCPEQYRMLCRDKLGIDSNYLVMGSFGFTTAAKRVGQILHALCQYRQETQRPFLLYIVGQLADTDVEGLIDALELEQNVVVTGYLELDDFEIYMGACDFCFNLRYPTQGESSAALHRMLGMGKSVVLTDIGSFRDYPDEISRKVSHGGDEVQEILATVHFFSDNKQELARLGKNAHEYAKRKLSLRTNIRRYKEFFGELLEEETVQEDYLDLTLDRLAQMGMDNEYFIEHIGEIWDGMLPTD